MILAPRSIDDLQHALASSAPHPIRLQGAGTKAADVEADGVTTLDLRGLSGLGVYDPAECVITAGGGTPVAAIEAALDAHGQYLPFDPTHVRAGGTIAGTVASGLSGSGRYRYGGVRDFIIGARLVDGRGRLIASGGQVVKNAAGFLTHHALVGSAGRLGAIAEVTFKVFPRPEQRVTLRLQAPFADAWAAHERVRAAAMDVEALDLDAPSHGPATLWVRLAGAADALPARLARTQSLVAAPSDALASGQDAQAWHDAAEFTWAGNAAAIVKVPSAPTRVAAVVAALGGLGRCRVQCGGAVVLLATSVDASQLNGVLIAHGWRGVVVQGPAHGRLLGAMPPSAAFGDRVRLALDPDQRFH